MNPLEAFPPLPVLPPLAALSPLPALPPLPGLPPLSSSDEEGRWVGYLQSQTTPQQIKQNRGRNGVY